ENVITGPAILMLPKFVAGRINFEDPKIIQTEIRVGFVARDSRTGIPTKQETAITRRHNAQKHVCRRAPVRSIPKLVAGRIHFDEPIISAAKRGGGLVAGNA